MCQFDRLRPAQWHDNSGRIASARVRHDVVRLLGQRQRNEIARNHSGNVAGRIRDDAVLTNQNLDLVHGGEAETVAIEPGRLASALAREYSDVVGQRLDAPEAEALVADTLADFLGGGREVLDCVYILLAKATAAVGDVQGAVGFRANDKPHGYPALVFGPVRVVSVLYQLVQHPIAVFGADHFVQVPETLVDLEILPVCIDGMA